MKPPPRPQPAPAPTAEDVDNVPSAMKAARPRRTKPAPRRQRRPRRTPFVL